MWKCVSRSLRITFKRSVLKCNTVLSTTALQNKERCLLKFTPGLIERCSRFYNVHKGTCDNFAKDKKDREGPKEKKTSFLGQLLENYFVDALRWSCIVALAGYYAVYDKRKNLFHICDLFERQQCPITTGYNGVVRYLLNSVKIKPYSYVIPEVKAAKCKRSSQQFTESASQKSDEENYSGLEEACQKVLGTLNNWLGTQCIQFGQHKKAIEYFIQSAEEEYAPGIFNLGICHEKGYGTSQNHQKAAELYQRAADLGHATAMYNLGVFYAQGIGGIQADINHARKLFKAAANLGQADAAKALNLEEISSKKLLENVSVSKSTEKGGNTLSELIFDNMIDQSSSNSLGHFNICDDEVKRYCDSFECADGKEINSLSGSDSGVLDLSPHTEPYILLV